jgi:hypothetical protein
MYPFDIVSGSHYIAVVRSGRIDVINGGSGEVVASMPADVFSEGIVSDLYGLAHQDSVIFAHNTPIPARHPYAADIPTGCFLAKIYNIDITNCRKETY